MFLTFPLYGVGQISKSLLRRWVDWAGEMTQQVEMLAPRTGNLSFDPQVTHGKRELTPPDGSLIPRSMLRRHEPLHAAWMPKQMIVVKDRKLSEGWNTDCMCSLFNKPRQRVRQDF